LLLELESQREQLEKLCEEADLRRYRHGKMQADLGWSPRALDEADQQIERVEKELHRVRSRKADLTRNIAMLTEERDVAAKEFVSLAQYVGIWEDEL